MLNQDPKLAPGEAGQRVEAAMDRLAELVTQHGPQPLVRGMPSYLAHEAIVACVEHLIQVLSVSTVSPDDFRHLITEYLPATPSYDLAEAITALLNERLKL